MSEAKPMTAAEYAAHSEAVKAQRPTEIVTLKSGSIFELKRPDLQGYVMTGRVPQSLLLAGMKAAKGAETFSAQDAADFPPFAASILRECCVKPKADEIDMLPEDAWEIFLWAMNYQGVAGIDGLRSFRPERESITTDKPDQQELQRETVSTVADER